MMQRPVHLPDFTDPPLVEVLLGVQFEPAPGITSVHMKDVWDLYRNQFPKIQEYSSLPPRFETFGGINLQPPVQIFPTIGGLGRRLWFLSADEDRLLQFQPDRFIANWRKHPSPTTYPRFESIAESYKSNLDALNSYFQKQFSYELRINQSELTYINYIPVEEFTDIGKWFSLWHNVVASIESLNAIFTEVIHDNTNKPFARLVHSIHTVYATGGTQKAFNLSLVFRGKPENSNISSAMDFLVQARESIVKRFAEITTTDAHRAWGRTK